MNKEQDIPLTPVGELGEFGLIKHLTGRVKISNNSTVRGIGDDAAVLDYDNGQTLLSVDMLTEGVHFDLTYMPLKHLGYKVAVSNFSDIAAMNALPQQLAVSLAVSGRFSVEALEELYAGILLACEKYKVDLVGGDTTSSLKGLVISGTVLGACEKGEVVCRHTAAENDLICVSGDLGAAYMGLQILEREKAVFNKTPGVQPDLEGYDYLLERQLKPEARTEIVKDLKEIRVKPTSMIDISDGLASDVLHLCSQSDKGCVLYEDKIPIDQLTYDTARKFNLDPSVCTLNGGEDYELLFTVRQGDIEKIKGHPDISVIGHMTEPAAGYHLIAKNGTQHPLTAQGWDALLKQDKKV